MESELAKVTKEKEEIKENYELLNDKNNKEILKLKDIIDKLEVINYVLIFYIRNQIKH